MPEIVDNFLVFACGFAAVFYLGRLLFRQFRAEQPACSKGCGNCSPVDFDKIGKEIQKKKPAV